MKKIFFTSFLFILLISCNKEEFPENPDWLELKISRMEKSPGYVYTTVYAYEWNKGHYYWVMNPVSSCGFCEFYNYDGVKIEMSNEKVVDFNINAVQLQIVWKKNH